MPRLISLNLGIVFSRPRKLFVNSVKLIIIAITAFLLHALYSASSASHILYGVVFPSPTGPDD